jgi:hypothetical protein
MGGVQMFAKKSARAGCEHENNVTVRNSGIERTVCESCGHVSFRAMDELSGKPDRSKFERDIERAHKSVH